MNTTQCLAHGQKLARCSCVNLKQQHLAVSQSDSAHTVSPKCSGSVVKLQFQFNLHHLVKKNNSCSFLFYILRCMMAFHCWLWKRVKVIQYLKSSEHFLEVRTPFISGHFVQLSQMWPDSAHIWSWNKKDLTIGGNEQLPSTDEDNWMCLKVLVKA